MGCYGIGLPRLIGAIVETHYDEKGIIWPKAVAPFQVHLIRINDTSKVKKAAEKIYQDLSSFAPQKRSYGGSTEAFSVGGQKEKIEVLYDDRENKTAGEKFADCDLIGIPYRIVVSERTLRENSLELKQRDRKKIKLVKINQIKKYVR
jgi:prolyl-tRNA synthetase